MPLTDLLAATRTTLAAHTPTPDLVAVHAATVGYLDEHGATALTRDLPEHLTASALVLDTTLTRALLCFHRKGGFWVQPGGHLDADDDAPATGALREMREETGVHRGVVGEPRLVDIDRHHLSASFGTCRTHVDLGFLVIADAGEPLAVSEESTDVAWWPLDALPDPLADRVAVRLARARVAARTTARPSTGG